VIVTWRPAALRDKRGQIEYLAARNATAAAELEVRLVDQTERLAQYPLMGRVGKVRGTRELPITRTNFVVIYRVVDSTVLIMRVLHGRQRWPPQPRRRS
jgi:toxin ParE1/3/4